MDRNNVKFYKNQWKCRYLDTSDRGWPYGSRLLWALNAALGNGDYLRSDDVVIGDEVAMIVQEVLDE